ncbi:Hint domain-containing protein [uncultured Tateyamaria sp.]|uniref:Hint domain-containing protein n=1 Tax=Tateyamaria sp. 1078 TaxID=3417464 RepID=UPI002632C46B|nr:Hint domain-containing protein [uncultured Tateyamaria sp.]
MTITQQTMIYIGNLAEIDTNESDGDGEFDSIPLGTYDQNTLQNTLVTGNDADSSGHISDDEQAFETVEYDFGGGLISTNTDHTAVYNITVLLGDGSTKTFDALLIQMTNGDTFLTDLLDNSEFDNLNIQTITVNSVGVDNYSGWLTGQSVDNSQIVCFTSGTLLSGPDGALPVDAVRPGTYLNTAENGPQPVRWIGRAKIDAARLAANPKLRPVRIMAGALAPGLPCNDLAVSRQHRMLVRSRIAERMFGEAEVLVPAIALVDLPGIFVDDTVGDVTYFHVLFDRHEVIYAEDAPTESLYAGPGALRTLSPAEIEEVQSIFPDLIEKKHLPDPARLMPSGVKRRNMMARLTKNGQPVLCASLEFGRAHDADQTGGMHNNS